MRVSEKVRSRAAPSPMWSRQAPTLTVILADAQVEDGQSDADGYLLASWSLQFGFGLGSR